MTRAALCISVFALLGGCGRSSSPRPAVEAAAPPTAETPQPAAAAAPRPASQPDADTTPATPPSRPAAPGTLVARIVEAGPTGGGRCVQRSYRVERTDVAGTDPFWVHFEHCEGSPPPDFDGAGLTIGETYRLRLVGDAGSSFGDGPMIVGAETP